MHSYLKADKLKIAFLGEWPKSESNGDTMIAVVMESTVGLISKLPPQINWGNHFYQKSILQLTFALPYSYLKQKCSFRL